MDSFDVLYGGAYRAHRILWKFNRWLSGKPEQDYAGAYKFEFALKRSNPIAENLWLHGSRPADVFFSEMQEISCPRVLEIGSRRIVAPIDKERLGKKYDYVGLDIQAGPNVDLVGDAHDLAELFGPESFDGIISFAVFEHIAKPWQVARAMNRILKPGGIVCIETHHAYPNHELPWDFWRYGHDAFGTIFNASNGFEIIEGGLGNSAKVMKRNRLSGPDHGGKHFLFTGVTARKVGPVQPVPNAWDFDYRKALPIHHSYPVGTYQIPDEALKFDGEIESHKPRVIPLKKWRQLIIATLAPSGSGLVVCGPSANPEQILRGLPKGWEWQIEQTPALRSCSEALNLPEGLFDAVVAFDPLSHVPHPWVTAVELSRAVKPGGHLISRELATPTYHREKPDYWCFTSESLRLVYPPDIGLTQNFSSFLEPLVVIADNAEDHPLVPLSDCFRWACAVFEKK